MSSFSSSKMFFATLLVATFLTFSKAEDNLLNNDISLRAPSFNINCDCQCESYTWIDQFGVIQGNCKNPDQTGGRWCYTSSRSCMDLQFSPTRRDSYGRRRAWSYEACATPPLGSSQCGGGFGNGFYNDVGNGFGSQQGNFYVPPLSGFGSNSVPSGPISLGSLLGLAPRDSVSTKSADSNDVVHFGQQ